jgi:hypothetical protein
MEWKWSKGEPYQKSARQKTVKENKQSNEPQNQQIQAYDISLNHDENSWELMNTVQQFSPEEFKITNKREQLDEKIADRHLVQQCGYNPFMNNDNYVNDITIRDQFLLPQNTNQGEDKEINERC